MLASILPGLRELRVPLAAGFIWLAATWAGTSFLFREPPAHSLLGDLSLLIGWVTLPTVLAALAFTAYLVGIIAKPVTFSPLVRHFINKRKVDDAALRELTVVLKNELEKARSRGLQATVLLRDFPVISNEESSRFSGDERLQEIEMVAAVNQTSSSRMPLDEADNTERWDWIIENARKFANDAIATRTRFSDYLLIKHKDAYDRLDRNIAEAEFREAVATPLLSLIGVCAIRVAIETGALWALIALIPALAISIGLLVSAHHRNADNDNTMARYIVSGTIDSPVITAIRNAK